MSLHSLTMPLTTDAVKSLRAGDGVRISGIVLAARDAAHKRMAESARKGQGLPVEIRGATIYYMGPTPARPGSPIGAAGPTTSGRMDPYTPLLLDLGLKGMIGKGRRGRAVREAMLAHEAVYFAAVGGAGALLAQHISAARVVAYEELGPEAVYELVLDEFPAIVINDVYGGDAYDSGQAPFRRKAAAVQEDGSGGGFSSPGAPASPRVSLENWRVR